MILKFMKSAWQYQDATNVVGYFPTPVVDATARPARSQRSAGRLLLSTAGTRTQSVRPLYKVVIDPAMALTIRDKAKTRDPAPDALGIPLLRSERPHRSALYGDALVRLIDFIRELAADGSGRCAHARRR